ncbi:MAG: segregation/condensation protein A [Pseudomonadota bacterium]
METLQAVAGQESQHSEIAMAVVAGQSMAELPKDLYIPPEALRIFLEAFEGPLDLLLYLIKKQNIDILNIPVAPITKQYVEYVEMMQVLKIELASDYLVMAATLAEIKSRMLLPRPKVDEEEIDDPRAELVRRLQEYESFKKAAENLREMPQLGRDFFPINNALPELNQERPLAQVKLTELVNAFKQVLARASLQQHHHIKLENLSVRERMSKILGQIEDKKFSEFTDFFNFEEGRMGVVVTFLAILELLKQSLIDIVQNQIFGPIHLQRVV